MSIDSGFNAPDNVDGLTDVTITNPQTDDVLFYNGTEWVNGPIGTHADLNDLKDVNTNSVYTGQTILYNGTDYINSDPLNTSLLTIPSPQTSRYYFTRNIAAQGGWSGYGSVLFPIRFQNAVTINKFAIGILNNPTDAQGNGGVKLRGFIYNIDGQGRPSTLHKDMGYFTIANGDTQSGYVGKEFTLASTTNLNANTLYYYGVAWGPLDGAKTNLCGVYTDIAGINNPYWGGGIPAAAIPSNLFAAAGFTIAGTNWSTFDYQNGSLPNNIHNALGFIQQPVRVGIQVSALV